MHCLPAHTTYLGKQYLLISRVAESEPVFLSWAGPQFEGSSFTQKVIKNRKMFWTYSRKPRVTKYNPRYVAAGISCIEDLRRGDKLLLYPNIQLMYMLYWPLCSNLLGHNPCRHRKHFLRLCNFLPVYA